MFLLKSISELTLLEKRRSEKTMLRSRWPTKSGEKKNFAKNYVTQAQV